MSDNPLSKIMPPGSVVPEMAQAAKTETKETGSGLASGSGSVGQTGLNLAGDQTQQLLNILIQQQARLALKDQQEEEAKRVREVQRQKNSQDHTAKDLLRQARCSHLKGGKKGPRSQVRDYAVYLHTFIDSHYEVRCFICKMIWKVNDTAEFLLRKGKRVPNHTKMGWFEATKMLEQTTNTPSSSEIPLQATPQAALAGPAED